MNCHNCKRELTIVKECSTYTQVECPENHATVFYKDNKILEYNLLWDADVHAKERFWINAFDDTIYSNTYHCIKRYGCNSLIGTIILKCTYGRPYHLDKIFELNDFIPLEIKDNIIQLNSLVPRLKRLKAFI